LFEPYASSRLRDEQQSRPRERRDLILGLGLVAIFDRVRHDILYQTHECNRSASIVTLAFDVYAGVRLTDQFNNSSARIRCFTQVKDLQLQVAVDRAGKVRIINELPRVQRWYVYCACMQDVRLIGAGDGFVEETRECRDFAKRFLNRASHIGNCSSLSFARSSSAARRARAFSVIGDP